MEQKWNKVRKIDQNLRNVHPELLKTDVIINQ